MELRLIFGLISSLLPEATRRRIVPANWHPSPHDAGLSGMAELLMSASALASMYFHIVPAAINGYMGRVGAVPGGEGKMVEFAGGVPVAYGMGFTALFAFMFRWQTLLAAYFGFEGAVRALAGFASDQVVPSMPLHLAQSFVLRTRDAIGRLKLPPLVEDDVRLAGDCLLIESCRPKPDWHRSACISYEETMYELVEERTGGRERPWVYRLQPAPAHKVVRGLRHYDPREVLKQ